jgi:hypothetical protein
MLQLPNLVDRQYSFAFDPFFWLGFSLLLVAISLTAVLVAAIPALLEIARAARSAEKLFDTLRQEFPPTLEAIRLTGLELGDLSEDLQDGVTSASEIVKQVDRSLTNAREKVDRVQINTKGFVAGVKVAWQVWHNSGNKKY